MKSSKLPFFAYRYKKSASSPKLLSELMSRKAAYKGEAEEYIVHNIKCAVQELIGVKKGNRSVDIQHDLDAISMAVMSDVIQERRLKSAVASATGLSVTQLERGLKLRRTYRNGMGERAKRKGPSAGPKAQFDKKWIVNYFHYHCDLVEIDKERNYAYKRKRYVPTTYFFHV